MLRADSGLGSHTTINACADHHVRFSITVRRTAQVRDTIDAITEHEWVDIAYTHGGHAQVAATRLGGHRLVVRRTRLTGARQEALFPDWRHHAFVTDRTGTPVDLDAGHRHPRRGRAGDPRPQTRVRAEPRPSAKFNANAAWAVLATIAHNLLRWVAALGLHIAGPVVAKTIRRRYLTIPGRLTRAARRDLLHLPRNWPWQHQYTAALQRLRSLPVCWPDRPAPPAARQHPIRPAMPLEADLTLPAPPNSTAPPPRWIYRHHHTPIDNVSTNPRIKNGGSRRRRQDAVGEPEEI